MPQFKLYVGSALHSTPQEFRSFVYTIVKNLEEDFRVTNLTETKTEHELPLQHDLSSARAADLVLGFVEHQSTDLGMTLQAVRENKSKFQDTLVCTPRTRSFPALVANYSHSYKYKYQGEKDVLFRVQRWRQRQQHSERYEGEPIPHFFYRLYIANPDEFQDWKEHFESSSTEDRNTATYEAALREVERRFREN